MGGGGEGVEGVGSNMGPMDREPTLFYLIL